MVSLTLPPSCLEFSLRGLPSPLPFTHLFSSVLNFASIASCPVLFILVGLSLKNKSPLLSFL